MSRGTSKALIMTGLAIAFLVPLIIMICYLIWYYWFDDQPGRGVVVMSSLSFLAFLIGMFIFTLGILNQIRSLCCMKTDGCDYQPQIELPVVPVKIPITKLDTPCEVKREMERPDILASF